MATNETKSYLSYHHLINKKTFNSDYSAFTEKSETNFKSSYLTLKLIIESELLSIGIILVKVALKISQEKYLLSILF